MLRYTKFLLAALLMVVSILATAQQQTANLTGTVTDIGGAAVPGATVTISDDQRGIKQTVTANERGEYSFTALPPSDNYTLTVSKDGFKELVQKSVSLQVAQSAKIDPALSVGAVTESVTVSSGAPLLDTQTSSLGQVITGQTVEDLPLNGRSTFRLIALTPGVTFSRSAYGQFGDVPVNSTWDTNLSINGGRSQSNEFLIDGVPTATGFFNQITTMPSVDETQEFKVESSNLSAAYGRYAGGVVNVSTKSGTNAIHGSVFEFLRNSWFDANDWFQKRAQLAAGQPNKVLPFKMNQFGGAAGGPIIRDRTFFFVSYQGTRRIKGQTFQRVVPTVAQKQGFFTTPIYDPFAVTGYSAGVTTRAQFAGNQIPQSRFDPAAAAILKYYPDPNISIPGSANNFAAGESVRVNQDFGSVRIDQNVSNWYHLFGRYAYTRTGLTQPNQTKNVADTAGAVGTTYFKNQSFALDNIMTLSPSLTVSVDYGFARWYQIRSTLSYGFDISTLNMPASLAKSATVPMFPAIGITNYLGLANQSYLNNGNDSHAIIVTATKQLGRQQIVFGADGRLHRINFFNVNNGTGTYNFTQAATRQKTSDTTGGDAFASFLLGVGGSGNFPLAVGNAVQNLYGAVFVQDNIRVTPKLTVNVGVRYDGESPYVDRNNRLNYFDTNVASPFKNATYPNLTGGLVFANTGGTSRAVYTRQHNNVAPRVGFAYSPNPTLAIRGGYGISYAPLEIANNAVGFVPNTGYSSTTSWNVTKQVPTGQPFAGAAIPGDLLSNPFPTGLVALSGNSQGVSTSVGQGLTVWNNNPATPMAQQWNLDWQQQLPGNALIDLGYSGSHGTHLTSGFERNSLDPKYNTQYGTQLAAAVPNPFFGQIAIGNLANPTIARRQTLLPFPQFTSVFEVNNPFGSSVYHSAQVKFVKRASHGITLLTAYTWSKLISNVNAQNAPIGTTNNTSPQNYYDLASERSVSELDQPHNFVTNFSWELPVGRGRHFLGSMNRGLDAVIGGWKLSGIWTEQSGFPLTITTSVAGGANRPNPVVGVSPVIPGKRTNAQQVSAWFNKAAYVQPAVYTYGTVRRTVTEKRGPGVQNLDATLAKTFSFTERFRADVRWELFNVTNTPHFADPDTNLNNTSTFGTITGLISSPPARQMQVAVKIHF